MKNAMKKLMSLMLVAVLLVSALPFQASAAEEGITVKAGGTDFKWTDAPETITKADVYYYLEMAQGDDAGLDANIEKVFASGSLTASEITMINLDNGTVTQKGQEGAKPPVEVEKDETEKTDSDDLVEFLRPGDDYTPVYTLNCVVNGTRTWSTTEKADGTTFGDLMDNHFTEDEGYSYKLTSKVYSKILTTVAVPAGDTVTIYITTDYADKNDGGFTTDKDNDSILNNGSSNNGGSNNGSNNNGSNNGSSGSKGDLWLDYTDKVNKYPYEVKLRVYLKGNLATLSKSFTITEGIAKDSLVTLGEVKTLLKNYYVAKDSDGLLLDGLYLYEGNWMGNWAYDTNRFDSVDNLNVARKYNEINLVVVLDNAKLKTTTNNSDNPKTGDGISLAMTTMGLSSAALAAVYVFGKKKYMI